MREQASCIDTGSNPVRCAKLFIMNMKSIIRDLLFDTELVKQARKANVNKDQLYNQLMQGRITLQEYLQIV